MKDDKGYSLVELIIVLAILAVIAAMVFYSFSLMVGQYARECANNTSAVLDKEKNYALAKSATVDCYVEIVMRENDGYYARYYVPKSAITQDEWILEEEQKLGRHKVEMTFTLKDITAGTTRDVTLDADTSVKLVFNRSSGAFKGAVVADGSDGDAGSLPDMSAAGIEQCTKITIIHGRTYELQLYPSTGKHVLSRLH